MQDLRKDLCNNTPIYTNVFQHGEGIHVSGRCVVAGEKGICVRQGCESERNVDE